MKMGLNGFLGEIFYKFCRRISYDKLLCLAKDECLNGVANGNKG